jgi:outer membrane biogenesis lipoprotein LolB
MKCLLALLFLTGCTIHVETRTEAEMERDEQTQRLEHSQVRCVQKCRPFKLESFSSWGECKCSPERIN